MFDKIYRPSLLLVFGNATLANTVRVYFIEKGYNIDITYNCKDGLTKAISNRYKLLILEKSKVDSNCIKLIQRIRSFDNHVPIIVISDKQNPEIDIYRSGANLNHYKPIDFNLLEAQIEKLLEYIRDKYQIEMLDINISLKTRVVKRNNKVVKLTKSEFDFLILLIKSNGHILHRNKIISNLMDYNKYVQNGAVDTLISRTRNKLAEKGVDTVIETVVGSGYRLNNTYARSCKFT